MLQCLVCSATEALKLLSLVFGTGLSVATTQILVGQVSQWGTLKMDS